MLTASELDRLEQLTSAFEGGSLEIRLEFVQLFCTVSESVQAFVRRKLRESESTVRDGVRLSSVVTGNRAYFDRLHWAGSLDVPRLSMADGEMLSRAMRLLSWAATKVVQWYHTPEGRENGQLRIRISVAVGNSLLVRDHLDSSRLTHPNLAVQSGAYTYCSHLVVDRLEGGQLVLAVDSETAEGFVVPARVMEGGESPHLVVFSDWVENQRNAPPFSGMARQIYNYTANPIDVIRDRFGRGVEECFLRGEGEPSDVKGYLGVELEVEPRTGLSTTGGLSGWVMQDLLEGFAICKSDASIGSGGFEIVTLPATFGYHMGGAWERFFEEGAQYLRSATTGRCGMHVHLDRRAFHPLHASKMAAFINGVPGRMPVVGQVAFVQLVADRPLERYTPRHDGTRLVYGLKDKQRLGISERGAFNTLKGPTFEVRIFRGTVNKKAFYKNLEFVQAMVEFTRVASIKGLDCLTFCEWLVQETGEAFPNLKEFLGGHGKLPGSRADERVVGLFKEHTGPWVRQQ